MIRKDMASMSNEMKAIHLQDMMNHPGFLIYREYIEGYREQAITNILACKPESHDIYRSAANVANDILRYPGDFILEHHPESVKNQEEKNG
jgi:hypothetical protein